MGIQTTSRALIDRLIGFPTVSADSNLDLIHFVGDYLTSWGVPFRLSHDATRSKANLFATIGEGGGGLVLSGHTDVVPTVGQAWSSDPFQVVQRGSRLYGRGACDMKGFLAIALAMVPQFLAKRLSAPIHLAFSYDEEVGCFGAQELIADLAKAGIRPAMALIGEPTSMQVINAHKGSDCFCTSITGVAVHSSQPQRGVSATFAAGRTIAFIAEMAREAELRADPSSDFTPPYTTFNVGMIGGGTAHNIVPSAATVNWEYRLVPWDDGAAVRARFDGFIEDSLRPWLVGQDPRAGVDTIRTAGIPPLKPDADSAIEKLALQLTGQNRAGAVAFGTEAGLFQQAGIQPVICGPGSIDQAHQPDEFIELDQIVACERFLDRLTDQLAA
jgi:acetylornithine deacetylase